MQVIRVTPRCRAALTFATLSAGALAAATLALSTPGGAQPSAPRTAGVADSIPLPEHPRPDWHRADWRNLNGRWQFAFDARNEGERAGWFRTGLPSPRQILVPFSWGAPLSGVPDSADIGWYARPISVPEAWRGRRIFLVVGASDWRTMRQYVLPNVLAPLIVMVTVYLSQAILSEAALSFLGLGTQPPEPSWGGMLNASRTYMELAPAMAIFPGLAIMLVVLGFNFLGDGLRDILDPRLRTV